MTSSAEPVILEVALNGATHRDRSAHVPQSADEIAADGIACIEAGASIVHMHNAEVGLDSEECARRVSAALTPIRRTHGSAVLYPHIESASSVVRRYRHHVVLSANGLIDMAVLDTGPINVAAVDANGVLPTSADTYANSPADIAHMMEVCRSSSIGASIAVYEPGFLRAAIAYHAAGAMPTGSLLKLYFSGESYLGGYPFFSPPPIQEAFELYDAMRRAASIASIPWSVAILGEDLLGTPVARLALERGGHLRVGLEDDPLGASNVEQVRAAVAFCEEFGRPIATPEQTRHTLRLPAS